MISEMTVEWLVPTRSKPIVLFHTNNAPTKPADNLQNRVARTLRSARSPPSSHWQHSSLTTRSKTAAKSPNCLPELCKETTTSITRDQFPFDETS